MRRKGSAADRGEERKGESVRERERACEKGREGDRVREMDGEGIVYKITICYNDIHHIITVYLNAHTNTHAHTHTNISCFV